LGIIMHERTRTLGHGRKSAEENNKNDKRFQNIDIRRETRKMREI